FGTTVTLSATASSGSEFKGWTGCESEEEGGKKCVVTMSAAKSVSASFALEKRLLTVNITGSGQITSSPTPQTGGGTCSAKFGHGAVVILTETATAGSEFKGWTGCESEEEGGKKCVVTMSAAKSVSASFALEKRLLTVNLTGSGSSSVSSSP